MQPQIQDSEPLTVKIGKKEGNAMKTNFVKILPLAAAVLLATSCSKDESNENNTVQSKTVEIPFSVQVKTGSKISKIAYTDGDNVTPSFDADDVNTLVLVVTGEGITEGNLTLENTDGKFSGTLKFESEEAATAVTNGTTDLSATITVEGEQTASTESISDLMEKCGHVYTASSTETGDIAPFKYTTETIYLCDGNSYLEVFWENKGNSEITINSTSYTLNSDGKLWLMIPAGTPISVSEFEIDNKTAVAGKIHSINRTYGVLSGVFSVSDTKKVRFSSGNLQYNSTTSTYNFATNQWNYMGDVEANKFGQGVRDLFGYATWVNGQPMGTVNYGSYYNWPSGVTDAQIGEGWKTLSFAEWTYLFNRSGKYGHGKVGDINGIILLPDTWTDPMANGSEFQSGNSAWANVYTKDQWVKMEKAGAVFLPAAGWRNDTSGNGSYSATVNAVNGLVGYWSSTSNGTVFIQANNRELRATTGNSGGFAVRLVRVQ